MKFAKFADSGGNSVFINPALVTHVKSVNDTNCRIYFDRDQTVVIPLQASLVCEDIEKASKS
jgi:hypothetical protein